MAQSHRSQPNRTGVINRRPVSSAAVRIFQPSLVIHRVQQLGKLTLPGVQQRLGLLVTFEYRLDQLGAHHNIEVGRDQVASTTFDRYASLSLSSTARSSIVLLAQT